MAKAAVAVSFVERSIAVLRMQRGENRINPDFVKAFNECLDKVESTPSCKGLVTVGEGKFFCNGLDTDWMGRAENAEMVAPFLMGFQELLARLLTFPVPTVAAINGHCYAGGALIALAHDFRVMNSQRGWFCLNEIFINRHFSPFIIAYFKAKMKSGSVFTRTLVMGQRFTADEAVKDELVDKAVPGALVEQESHRMLKAWLPKDGYSRESMLDMKRNVYADALKLLYVAKL